MLALGYCLLTIPYSPLTITLWPCFSNNLIASVNGNLVKESEATISIMDRGFTLADGVFETMIARRNKVINFDIFIIKQNKKETLCQ